MPGKLAKKDINRNETHKKVLSGPQIVLFDCGYNDKNQQYQLYECGDGLLSGSSGFDAVNKKSDECYMTYLILKKLGEHYDRLLILADPERDNYMKKMLQALNQESHTPNKYVLASNTSERKLYGSDECIEDLEDTLKTIDEKTKGSSSQSWCIISSNNRATKLQNFHYAQQLQKDIRKNKKYANMVVVNAESLTPALTENKFTFMHFKDPSTVAQHCLNLVTINEDRIIEIQKIAGDKPIVLKPLDKATGNGVIVIPKNEFPRYINFLKDLVLLRRKYENSWLAYQEEKEIYQLAEMIFENHRIDKNHLQDRRYKTWLLDYFSDDPYAIWQPCFESKKINEHIATFRMNFIILPDMSVYFIGGYGKLAEKTFENALTTDNIVSGDFHKNVGDISAAIDPEDAKILSELLSKELLQIYQRNMSKTFLDHLVDLHNHPDNTVKDIAKQLVMTLLTQEDQEVMEEKLLPKPKAAIKLEEIDPQLSSSDCTIDGDGFINFLVPSFTQPSDDENFIEFTLPNFDNLKNSQPLDSNQHQTFFFSSSNDNKKQNEEFHRDLTVEIVSSDSEDEKFTPFKPK